MTVSLIVSTKDRLQELARLLETVRVQTRKPDELVVVDAGCDPKVEALVRGQKDAIKTVTYHAYPSSLTQARNYGIRNSSGAVVVFLDDDAFIEPDFIAEIARPIESDREGTIAGVTGDLIGYPRGKTPIKQAFKVLFQLPCDGDGRFRLSGAPTIPHGLADQRDVEFLPGGLTAWRREVFAEFLFDESLPGLGVNEDVDFSYRVSRKWRNLYTPLARAGTIRPESRRESTLAYLGQELSSSWRLYRKNLPKDPLRFAAFLWHQAGLLVRYGFRLLR